MNRKKARKQLIRTIALRMAKDKIVEALAKNGIEDEELPPGEIAKYAVFLLKEQPELLAKAETYLRELMK